MVLGTTDSDELKEWCNRQWVVLVTPLPGEPPPLPLGVLALGSCPPHLTGTPKAYSQSNHTQQVTTPKLFITRNLGLTRASLRNKSDG